jgi:hypothetical protein
MAADASLSCSALATLRNAGAWGMRPATRYVYYSGSTLSGIAAPQASVSSRRADCQFRVTMS